MSCELPRDVIGWLRGSLFSAAETRTPLYATYLVPRILPLSLSKIQDALLWLHKILAWKVDDCWIKNIWGVPYKPRNGARSGEGLSRQVWRQNTHMMLLILNRMQWVYKKNAKRGHSWDRILVPLPRRFEYSVSMLMILFLSLQLLYNTTNC